MVILLACADAEVPDAGEDALLFYSAAVVSGDFDASDALGSYLTPGTGGSLEYPQPLDFDGDATLDLLLLTQGDAETGAYLLRGGELPGPHDPLPTRTLRIGPGPACGYYTAPCVGDFNGDGFDDIVSRQSTYDPDEADYDLYILPGFDVPWDDDASW